MARGYVRSKDVYVIARDEEERGSSVPFMDMFLGAKSPSTRSPYKTSTSFQSLAERAFGNLGPSYNTLTSEVLLGRLHRSGLCGKSC